MAANRSSPARTAWLAAMEIEEADAADAAEAFDAEAVVLRADAVTADASVAALRQAMVDAESAYKAKHAQADEAHYYAYNTGGGYQPTQAAIERDYRAEIPGLLATLQAAEAAWVAGREVGINKRCEAELKQHNAAILRGANPA